MTETKPQPTDMAIQKALKADQIQQHWNRQIPMTYAMMNGIPAYYQAEAILQRVISWLVNGEPEKREPSLFQVLPRKNKLDTDAQSICNALVEEIGEVASNTPDRCILLEHMIDCILQRSYPHHLPTGILGRLAEILRKESPPNRVHYKMIGDLYPYMTQLVLKGVFNHNPDPTDRDVETLKRVQALNYVYVPDKTPEDLLAWYQERKIPYERPFQITNKDMHEFRDSQGEIPIPDASDKQIMLLGMHEVPRKVVLKHHVDEWHPNRFCQTRGFVGDPHAEYLYLRGTNGMYVTQPSQYKLQLRRE